MQHFSTLDLTKNIKSVTDAAIKGPVAITKRGKPKFVMLTMDYFQRLQKGPDPRRVYRVEETPPELAEMFLAHIDKFLEENESSD